MELVAYRSTVVTPDTAEALRLLEKAAAERGGMRIRYRGVSRAEATWEGTGKARGPTGLPPALSMRPAGREVYLSLELEAHPENRMEELAALWALAIPLGFVPWSRFPVPGSTDMVFHYLGPWARLGDSLQGEGRGEQVWPSMCAAAQCQVRTWGGPRIREYSIQTHLHRLGISCGPVDGVIGERTLGALKAMGFGGMALDEAGKALATLSVPKAKGPGEKSSGIFTYTGTQTVEPFSAGDIRISRVPTGISVEVDGPGRLILLFGGYSR